MARLTVEGETLVSSGHRHLNDTTQIAAETMGRLTGTNRVHRGVWAKNPFSPTAGSCWLVRVGRVRAARSWRTAAT